MVRPCVFHPSLKHSLGMVAFPWWMQVLARLGCPHIPPSPYWSGLLWQWGLLELNHIRSKARCSPLPRALWGRRRGWG